MEESQMDGEVYCMKTEILEAKNVTFLFPTTNIIANT
jgi:hypothetical protein